jgi:hypothetical protein
MHFWARFIAQFSFSSKEGRGWACLVAFSRPVISQPNTTDPYAFGVSRLIWAYIYMFHENVHENFLIAAVNALAGCR